MPARTGLANEFHCFRHFVGYLGRCHDRAIKRRKHTYAWRGRHGMAIGVDSGMVVCIFWSERPATFGRHRVRGVRTSRRS